jgi:hypothetical protein
MFCTKKFYILIIIRGFTSIKNGLNSKVYVKFIKGINTLLSMTILKKAVHKIMGGAFTGIIAMWAR